ncbi:MAG: hypothetical protein PHF67_02090 [Candidatus Nanoarchaeia archaeon]|nr:hypothetical protein [Candidatus Nanoarchaeia archaeon]
MVTKTRRYFFEVRNHLLNITDELEFLEKLEELKESNPFLSFTEAIRVGKRKVGKAEAYLGKQCYRRIDGKNFCRKYHALQGELNTDELTTAFQWLMQHVGSGPDMHYAQFRLGERAKYGHQILEEITWNEGVVEKQIYGEHPKREIILPGSRLYALLKARLKSID